MPVPSLEHAITAHLTRVYRWPYSTTDNGLAVVLRWVNDQVGTGLGALRLPLLSCQAAGGDPVQAIPVAAAWHLLRCAAHLLDDVADEATLILEPAQSVNAAVALIFLAQVSLTTLYPSQSGTYGDSAITAERVVALVNTINTTAARMAQGQAADLAWDEATATLEHYWRLAGAKTGEFFALACRAGAMLGTDDQAEVDIYATYGYHLGMLVQLGDDLQGLWRPSGQDDLVTAGRTLPVVYALTVASGDVRDRLLTLVRDAPGDRAALHELQSMLAGDALASDEAASALHYLALQAARQHHLARAALLSSAHPSVPQHELIEVLNSAFPAVSETQQEIWRKSRDSRASGP